MGSQVKTECGDCIFFAYYNGPLCMFERIEKFDNFNQVEYNKEGSTTIQRLCNTCRNETSIKQKYPNLDHTKVDDILKIKELVRESVIPKVDFIVLVNEDNFKNIQVTIDSIKNMEILPTTVVFGIDGDVNAKEVYTLSKQLYSSIESVYVVSLFTKKPDRIEVIDNSFRKCKSFFVSLFEAGYSIPSNLINQLDDMMNEHLLVVPMVTNSDKSINGETICRSFFDLGLTYNGLTDFIRGQLKEQNMEEIVWNQK